MNFSSLKSPALVLTAFALSIIVPDASRHAKLWAQPVDSVDDADDDDDAEQDVPDADEAPDIDIADDDDQADVAMDDDASSGEVDAIDDTAADDMPDDAPDAADADSDSGAQPADDDAADDDDGDADTGDAPAAAAASDDDDDDDDADTPETGLIAREADDDDDDDDMSETGEAQGADDDDDDDDRDGDDDDAPQYVGVEASSEREKLDQLERIDSDNDGFRYRRGEVVALGVDDADMARLTSAGFEVIARERVTALGATATLFKTPARVSDTDALVALDDMLPENSFGLNHLYDRASVRVRGKGPKAMPEKQGCGCRIGVIDTGVAASLPGLKHARLVQASFNGAAPGAGLHGTVISSLIAGTKARDGAQTEIIVGDVFSGPRRTAGSAFAVIKALNWMAERGVAVINVSLSGASNKALADAIARLSARGHVIVAAAGNDGPAAPPAFPAAYPQVVAVTAVDAGDNVYRYAGRGPHINFSARGVDVVGLDQQGKPQSVTGTSFAAPAVAMRLAQSVKTPDPRAASAALKALEASARDLGAPGRDPVFGAGLVEN